MPERPTSVTVICWFLIVFNALSIVVSAVFFIVPDAKQSTTEISDLPFAVQMAGLYAANIIGLVSGLFMLKGKNWARWLYIVGSVCGLIYSLAFTKIPLMMQLPGVVFFIAILILLFRYPANDFFLMASLKDGYYRPNLPPGFGYD